MDITNISLQTRHKICTRCKKTKPLAAFGKRKKYKDGFNIYCKFCECEEKRRWLLKDDNKSKARERVRKRRLEIRKAIFHAYGDKCICCGESNSLFLTIDHIDNDGAAHRRRECGLNSNTAKIGGTAFYNWIFQNNFPCGLQILCWNCNAGKHLNKGICPHKTKEQVVCSIC